MGEVGKPFLGLKLATVLGLDIQTNPFLNSFVKKCYCALLGLPIMWSLVEGVPSLILL